MPTASMSSNPPPAAAGSDANGEQSGAAVQSAIAVDSANIRPLDIAGALRILIAEIRAAFDLPLPGPLQIESSTADLQLRTAREVVEIVLQALPRLDGDAAAWSLALPRAEQSLAAGTGCALNVISTWKDIPAAVVRDVQDSSRLAAAVLSDEMLNPLWMRPEWLALAPQLKRYVRFRRALRRRATQPGFWPESFEDDNEYKQ